MYKNRSKIIKAIFSKIVRGSFVRYSSRYVFIVYHEEEKIFQ